MRRIHGVEDILLGFEPKDAGSIPAGSVINIFFLTSNLFVFLVSVEILQVTDIYHGDGSETIDPEILIEMDLFQKSTRTD